MIKENLYNTWASRNPQWEKRYEESIFKKFCDYKKGETSLREDRGKIFGAGYEIFIVAFFIGLYFNQRRPLINDSTKRKSFGWEIENWGNINKSNNRVPYPKLREYIFIALIARTDIDFIALEKGNISSDKAVRMLMQTMEEYANFGLHFIEDKLIDDPNYFFKERAFLEIFLSFDNSLSTNNDEDDDEPDSLD